MSSRPQFSPYAAIKNGDMSGDLVSAVTIIQKLSMMSYALVWSGSSPVGTVSVQVSNDFQLGADGNVLNAGTWDTILLGYNGNQVSTIPVSGNSGSGFIDIDQHGGYAIRLIYTAASGTGTLNATINAKVA